MSIRGERFTLDLSDDEETPPKGTVDAQSGGSGAAAAGVGLDFVGDIIERHATTAKAPTAPTMKSTITGFPEHKKRTRLSAFKQQRSNTAALQNPALSAPKFQPTAPITSQSSTHSGNLERDERRRIDQENRERLADMSESEIKQEREELFSSLSPSLIESLLKRANLDDGRGDTGIDFDKPAEQKEEDAGQKIPEQDAEVVPVAQQGGRRISISKMVTQDITEAIPLTKPEGRRVIASKTVSFAEDDEPPEVGQLQPASQFLKEALNDSTPTMHFPTAPTAPDLDPSDPSFLEHLHTKYFPSLPADPTKLAWMAPIPTHGSIADQDSPYYPARETIAASALRFDFRGSILPPRIARAMPSTRGLHHHGEAPESAGYTVPELARLARSVFPAQRCIAFQTLGRLLYRLGRGEWDEGSEISKGLWKCMEEGKVVETLELAANAEAGHQGAKTYAVEAVWLWQKGGGQVWKAS